MNNINKIRFGFCFAGAAFCMTIAVCQSPGFQELNPVLGFIFNNYNDYHVIFTYAFMWAVVFTVYSYGEDKISKYYLDYMSNLILFVGFFDLLHNVIVVLKL